MKDIFNDLPVVFYVPDFDNLLIFNPGNIFMFPTVEGTSKKKLIIRDMEDWVDRFKHEAYYIGEL